MLQHQICSACYATALWEQQLEQERDRRRDVRAAAIDALARAALVLDVESTGLDDDAEMIDSLVKPVGPVTPGARAIHGIDDAMLADAPDWPAVYQRVAPLLAGQPVVAHNAEFEQRLLAQDCRRHQLAPIAVAGWTCTMEMGSPLNEGRWPNLARALGLAGVAVDETLPAHRALGDAQRCRLLLHGLAQLA